MAGSIEVQLRNAQSSILFMQQEHAQTLQGLHRELQKLQKKCAELTFELAMKGDDIDEDHFKEQQQKLESNLKRTEGEVQELQEQVEEKDTEIFNIEQKLQVQEKKHCSELKQYKKTFSSLNNELDQKSANIAYLTSQLHQMALMRHKARVNPKDGVICSNSPQPPQKPPPSHRRRVRTPSVESISVIKNGKVTSTISESYDGNSSMDLSRHHRRLSSPANSRSFDEREFSAFVAKVDTATSDIEIKPAPPLLPPISPFPQENRSVCASSSFSPTHSPYYPRRSVRVTKARESDPCEVNSLAVQAFHRKNKDLHTAQQSNRDSS